MCLNANTFDCNKFQIVEFSPDEHQVCNNKKPCVAEIRITMKDCLKTTAGGRSFYIVRITAASYNFSKRLTMILACHETVMKFCSKLRYFIIEFLNDMLCIRHFFIASWLYFSTKRFQNGRMVMAKNLILFLVPSIEYAVHFYFVSSCTRTVKDIFHTNLKLWIPIKYAK